MSLIPFMAMPLAAATASALPLQTLEYARPAGVPLYMDVSIPAGSGPFPAAIVIHGGGWVRGDRRLDVAPLFKPLEKAGIAWFSIDYRLLRSVTDLGATLEDVKTAILYIKEHAAQFRIDPENIALVGESAGGQLAAMAALRPTAGTRVKAVVAFYAPTDLEAYAKDSDLIPAQIRNSLRGTPLEALLLMALKQYSPIEVLGAVNAGSEIPPFLLIHGTKDALVPYAQSQAMCEKMNSAGSDCQLYAVEGGGHGMRWWESALPSEGSKYKTAMVQWLSRELKPGPANSALKR